MSLNNDENEEEESCLEKKIDLLSKGSQPESIDAYAPQIILSPLTSSLHFQELNHSTFSPDLSPFYDILDQSTSFRERWKKFRNFFYLYPNDSSKLLIDFYNSVKEWSTALKPINNIISSHKGNHIPFFKLLLLPTFDEFFQTVAVMYESIKGEKIKINAVNDQDFICFIEQNSQKTSNTNNTNDTNNTNNTNDTCNTNETNDTKNASNIIKKIYEVFENIFLVLPNDNSNNTNNWNKTKDGKKTDNENNTKNSKKSKSKANTNDNTNSNDTNKLQNSKFANVNDTLREIIMENRINIILNKYFTSKSIDIKFFVSIPIYKDFNIPTGKKIENAPPDCFINFIKMVTESFPHFQQIFAHLSSAIPIIKYIKEPISFQNDSQKKPILDILRVKQSKMTFRYFIYSLMLIKNFHSIIHLTQAYYSATKIPPTFKVLESLNKLFYQQYKLSKFILKYEENFQLLVRQNILIFLYYLKEFKYIGENPERRIRLTKQEDEEEKDENEKVYFRFQDDFTTTNPEADIDLQKDKNKQNDQNDKKQKPTTSPAQSSNVEALRQENIEDNKLYLRKLKSLIPTSFTTEAFSTSSSMFSSMLLALFNKVKFSDNKGDYLYQWPMAIDFRNTLDELSDYSFLYLRLGSEKSTMDTEKKGGIKEENGKLKKKRDSMSLVKQMILCATDPTHNSFYNYSNTNFLSLFSIYDSALATAPFLKDEIEEEAEKLLIKTLNRVARCLIGVNDIIINVNKKEQSTSSEEYKYDDYNNPENNVNNRFVDLLSIKSFQMLGKLYQIGNIISEKLNLIFLEKIEKLIYDSSKETKISTSINNLKSHREQIMLLNTRHEFLIAKGAILDPFENMMKIAMMIQKPGQIESRVSFRWSERIVNVIIKNFHFNIANSEFEANEECLCNNEHEEDNLINDNDQTNNINDNDNKVNESEDENKEDQKNIIKGDILNDQDKNDNKNKLDYKSSDYFSSDFLDEGNKDIHTKNIINLAEPDENNDDNNIEHNKIKETNKDNEINITNDNDANIIEQPNDEKENDQDIHSNYNIFDEIESESDFSGEKYKSAPPKTTKEKNSNLIKFTPENLYSLLKITPYGGVTHYIKRILLSLNDTNKMQELVENINFLQDRLVSLDPCPIHPYGPDVESQFTSYKKTIESLKNDNFKEYFEDLYNEMNVFGNHLCMLLILDLASEVDQSNHYTFKYYIWRSLEAANGKQACSYIFDDSWFVSEPKNTKKKGDQNDDVFLSEKIDNKSKYFQMLAEQYDSGVPKDHMTYSNQILKNDRKSEVDINSSLIEGILHFKRIIQSSDELKTDRLINLINVMLFYIVLNNDKFTIKDHISGGFLMCVVTLLKALNMWNSFKIESVIQRLCYQLMHKNNKKSKEGNAHKHDELSKYSNFLFTLFYQLELCDYYIS